MLSLAAMKKVDSKEPVNRGMLDEAVQAILEGMDKMVGGLRSEMNSRFEKVDDNLRQLDVELSGVKDTVNGLKAEFSDTPSRKEFTELKAKVDKFHPIA